MGEYVIKPTRRAGTTGELTLDEVKDIELTKIGWVLNDAGETSAGIDSRHAQALWCKLLKYEFQIWRDGLLLWWGAPWKREITPGRLEMRWRSLFQYFYKRFNHGDVSNNDLIYTQVDQTTIGWNLINYAQTRWTGAGLGITAGPIPGSGVLRDRTYERDKHGNIAELVKNLTNVIDGFDFEIEIYGDGRREWTPYYPSKGTLRPETPLEWGTNIADYTLDDDAFSMANFVTYTGAGEGPAKLEQTHSDSTSITEWGLMQDVLSDPDVKETPTLLGKAQAEVGVRKNGTRLVQLTVEEARNSQTAAIEIPLIGVLKTGDRCPVKIDDGEAQVNATYRIVAIDLDPKTERMELQVNLA